MKAKFVNEEIVIPGNATAYPQKGDPHAEFERVKNLLLDVIKEKVADEESPVWSEIQKLVSTNEHDKDAMGDLWKNTFTEQFLNPVIDALELIKTKTEELENTEGVGSMNFHAKKKKGLFKK